MAEKFRSHGNVVRQLRDGEESAVLHTDHGSFPLFDVREDEATEALWSADMPLFVWPGVDWEFILLAKNLVANIGQSNDEWPNIIVKHIIEIQGTGLSDWNLADTEEEEDGEDS